MLKINDPVKTKIQTYAPISGFAALGIVAFSIAFTLFTYQGQISSDSYSVFNHFISELGHTIDSPFYFVFSLGLCIGSLLLILLLMGFGYHIDSRLARRAMRVGVFSCIACFFVGIFPGNTYKYAHLVVALTFFFGSMLSVAMFSIAIYRAEHIDIPKWHIFPSLFMVGNSAIFLSLPNDTVRQFLADRATFERPELWLKPFFEWMVLISIFLWMFFIARHLYFYNKRQPIQQNKS